MDLLMTGQNGLQDSVKLQKAAMQIGSASASDIQLASNRLSSNQLQLFYSDHIQSNSKALILGDKIALFDSGNDRKARIDCAADLHDEGLPMLENFSPRLQMTFSARALR